MNRLLSPRGRYVLTLLRGLTRILFCSLKQFNVSTRLRLDARTSHKVFCPRRPKLPEPHCLHSILVLHSHRHLSWSRRRTRSVSPSFLLSNSDTSASEPRTPLLRLRASPDIFLGKERRCVVLRFPVWCGSFAHVRSRINENTMRKCAIRSCRMGPDCNGFCVRWEATPPFFFLCSVWKWSCCKRATDTALVRVSVNLYSGSSALFVVNSEWHLQWMLVCSRSRHMG